MRPNRGKLCQSTAPSGLDSQSGKIRWLTYDLWWSRQDPKIILSEVEIDRQEFVGLSGVNSNAHLSPEL